MKQILLPILGTFVFILAIGLFIQKYGQNSRFKLFVTPTPDNTKVIYLGQNKVNVEIADTASSRSEGLSNRKELKPETGMLFVFENKDIYPVFWMKDMLFSVDMVWINDDKITQINSRVPTPKTGTPDKELGRYTTKSPVDYVLEVPAGFCEDNRIKVGSEIDLSRL